MKLQLFGLVSLAATSLTACTANVDILCYDDSDQLIACEAMPDEPELQDSNSLTIDDDLLVGQDSAADYVFGPDDLDGMANEAVLLSLADDPETAREAAVTTIAAGAPSRTDVTAGRTKNAERRKLLPIGRSQGTRRYVIMRLTPADLPNLAVGDVVRAA